MADDVPLAALPVALGAFPKQGQVLPQFQDPRAVQLQAGQGLASVLADASGVPDALRALRGEMTPEEAQNFALTALPGLIPGAKAEKVAAQAAEEAAPALMRGIKAFHGSPYDFDRFDISKIGTGEGAQAFGHGLYFAENPDTAAAYKHSTSDLKDWPIIGGDPDWRVPSWVGKTANASPRGLDQMIAEFSNRAEQMKAENHWNAGGIQNIVDALTAVKEGKAELKKPGHQYEVSINADPAHFLDWDKPLSEQHPKVQEALKGKTEAPLYPDTPGNAIPGFFSPNSQRATQALRDAGIPGIKYLDQGSRDTGAGTRNYVVFDDKLIDIIKKYGWAGLAAALGGSQMPQMPQAQAPSGPPMVTQ